MWDHLRDPRTGAPVTLDVAANDAAATEDAATGGAATDGVTLRTRDGQPAATWHPAERRLDWPIHAPLAHAEAAEWDRRARELAPFPLPRPDGPEWWDADICRGASLDPIRRAHPSLGKVEGRRVLVLDGSGTDAWRFVEHGALRVDHVDVSSGMQRVALARLRRMGTPTDRLLFHRVEAEALPFRAASFDLAFARGTVHHLDRRRFFPELHRVLAPGAEALLLEPRLSPALQSVLRLRRGLRRIDRGADRPLGDRDLETLRALFREVDVAFEGTLQPILTRLPRRARSRWSVRLRPVEGALDARPRLGRWLGAFASVYLRR
ncbi:MAG TPA: class I SAM-dependent methyltransferase [Polyangiaceae bacterium LLY-WYZ-15_(1-7)]|nr:hypothetical protein [Sandaracinus sp.]HJL06138.1 class I SAM-dependent methyltransferase [Polyangiaceae bacterium LLY-WYZ-15_(1-7)]MBJ75248.1 hypothetical protein [Sandaracinus sp.]HJL11813.1 class I SAM-dependent methyltransferase [Polyangiaceae bacterium LLY-WYZ-15_(1-7)]HJL22282.1 class I SAM-dependent methyltransferase [Polyangiaceae bacterium LLY-WYZ-15_(1-7)]